MTPLTIEMLDGPYAGQQSSFDSEVITFGRGADNTLVVSTPHASRQHGELAFQDGRWRLINQSPNGTTVNRRRHGDKPVALRDGDVIGVGTAVMFRLQIAEEEGVALPVDVGASADSTAAPAKRRGRLWLTIGGYWLVIVAVGLLLYSRGGKSTLDPDAAFTPQQIRDEIRLQPDAMPDEELALEALDLARRRFASRRATPDGLYAAHEAYKVALAYRGLPDFDDPKDTGQFIRAQDDLTREVTEQYRQANNYLRRGQWDKAEESLRQLQRMYPADHSSSALASHVAQQLKIAIKNQGKKRRRLR